MPGCDSLDNTTPCSCTTPCSSETHFVYINSNGRLDSFQHYQEATGAWPSTNPCKQRLCLLPIQPNVLHKPPLKALCYTTLPIELASFMFNDRGCYISQPVSHQHFFVLFILRMSFICNIPMFCHMYLHLCYLSHSKLLYNCSYNIPLARVTERSITLCFTDTRVCYSLDPCGCVIF